MSTTSKKIVSVALTATTMTWMLGFAALPLANAQSASSLQAQIAALLAQIQQLQTQLNASGGSSTSYNFTSDLTVGSTGADVSALQQLLISKGYLTAVSAPTGYFGSLTQAALGAWQAAVGISPAAGYFGPKTRAFVNSMSVGTGTGTGTGGGTVVAPATGLSVSLAGDNPAPGSLISGTNGAARVPVMAVNFTAGNSGAVTVSELKFHKTGVLSDSSVAGAYLTMNGKVIAQYNSINQGVVDFSGLNWQIPAGTTQEIMLAIDVAGGLAAGNTTGFSLTSMSDVSAWDTHNTAITPNGLFPMNGNTFTVTTVTNPSLATLTVTSTPIGTQVTAGTQGNLVGAFNFTVGNSKVWLKGLNFRVIGSANKGDIRNVKLMVNGTQVGNTLATVAQDGTAYFDASAAPGILNTGSNNVQVFADVMGSPSYNFQFEVLNSYDVLAVDSQYNVPIQAGTAVGTQVSILKGQITVTQDTATPTGNVAKGQSQITLAKFDIYAAGEAVRIKFLDISLAFTFASTAPATRLSNELQNVALVDDAGGQVGSTINTPPSAASCAAGTSAYSTSTNTGTYTDCFGTSASPINYVVPANTTRVLSLKADVQSTADFATVTASLVADSNNLQGLTSSQLNSSSGANGSALSLSSSSMTIGQNNALGSQAVSSGVTGQKIGSYAFSASSAEGVNVNNVSIIANGAFFQNLKVLVKGVQFGTTQGVVSSGTTYTFSGSPFNVPAGTTVNVDVYADTLSTATAGALISPATSLSSCSATGAISYSSITCGSQNGQNITFAGASTITVTADSSQAPVGKIVMGSAGNPLATFRITETANVENVKITDLKVLDLVGSTSVTSSTYTKAAFNNLTLWSGGLNLGSAGSAVAAASGTAYIYSFHFGTPVIVPQANSVSLVLKGDAASYASSGATDNSTSTFEIATGFDSSTNTSTQAVVALGQTSNKAAAVTISSANGNAQTILRSRLTFAATPLGAASGRGKISSDQLATLSFSADAAGPIAVNTVTVTFSGTAPSSTVVAFLSGVTLRDENNNSIGAPGFATSTAYSNASTSCNLTVGATCSITFSFGTVASGTAQVVSAGTTRNWTLVVDSTKTQAVTGTSNVNLVATINAIGDISYTDGLDTPAVTNLNLPSSILTPINLNSVVYQQGT